MNGDRSIWSSRLQRRIAPLAYIGGATIAIAAAEWLLLASLQLLIGAVPDQYRQPRVYQAVTPVGFAFWGWWRAARLNPLGDQGYRRWLASSPWQADRPLPFGRIGLHGIDLVPLAASAAASLVHSLGWVLALLYFGAYSMSVLYAAGWQGHYVVAGIGAAGFSLLPAALIHVAHYEIIWPAVACVVWALPWAWLAWRRSVQSLARQDVADLMADESRADRTRFDAEWPRVHRWAAFDLEPAISRSDMVAVVAALGWLAGVGVATLHVVLQAAPDPDFPSLDSVAVGTGLLFGVIAAAVRASVYLNQCQAPLGLWARLRLGRLLIPDYDRAYLAPVVTLAAAAFVAFFNHVLPTPPVIAAALNVMAPAAVAIGWPPSLSEWRLTGGYRMVAGPPPLQKSQRTSRSRRMKSV